MGMAAAVASVSFIAMTPVDDRSWMMFGAYACAAIAKWIAIGWVPQ